MFRKSEKSRDSDRSEGNCLPDRAAPARIGKMNEAAWLFGILLCSLGVALCTKAGFGLSMIAAPAYILHRRLVLLSPFFTQGTCEYLWQGILLIVMCLGIRRFRLRYLLSFATGVLFGFSLDFWLRLLGGGTVCPTLGSRILFFALGEGVTALAVAFYFRTSLPLQIYERLVTAFASCYHIPTDRMKLINDVAMLLLSLLLALTLNRSLDGVGLGTVVITAVNAPLIGLSGRLLDRFFRFDPRFPRLCACLAGEE